MFLILPNGQRRRYCLAVSFSFANWFCGEITHRLCDLFGSHYLISNNCGEILPNFGANWLMTLRRARKSLVITVLSLRPKISAISLPLKPPMICNRSGSRYSLSLRWLARRHRQALADSFRKGAHSHDGEWWKAKLWPHCHSLGCRENAKRARMFIG